MQHTFFVSNLESTDKVARLIARDIVSQGGFVVALAGELGAGKTTLVRGILLDMGVSGSIKSPTFTLVEPYTTTQGHVYHFDLYRLADPEEWFDLGFDEYFGNDAICFIEWAEKAGGLIPQKDWQIEITMLDDVNTAARNIKIIATSDKGNACLKALIKHAEA